MYISQKQINNQIMAINFPAFVFFSVDNSISKDRSELLENNICFEMTSLTDAITKIDALIEALKSNSFTSSKSSQNNSSHRIAPAQPPPHVAAKPAQSKKEIQGDNAGQEKAVRKKQQPKQKTGGGTEQADSPLDTFRKARIVVARVNQVLEHPESDKLYITQVQTGQDQTRQIVAGLKKYIDIEQLQDSLVCVILNLKAAKLAGQLSEGMILAASSKDGTMVKPLRPSPDAQPGDAIYLEGTSGVPLEEEYPKILKSGPWAKILEGLRVKNEKACFMGLPFLVGKEQKNVDASGMPDESTIN